MQRAKKTRLSRKRGRTIAKLRRTDVRRSEPRKGKTMKKQPMKPNPVEEALKVPGAKPTLPNSAGRKPFGNAFIAEARRRPETPPVKGVSRVFVHLPCLLSQLAFPHLPTFDLSPLVGEPPPSYPVGMPRRQRPGPACPVVWSTQPFRRPAGKSNGRG